MPADVEADDAESTAARKKAHMDERMAARKLELERQREARKGTEDSSTRELVVAFETSFARGLADTQSAVDGASAAAELNDVGVKVQELHQSVATASSFLPSQTLERSTRSISELEAAVRAKREQLAPRKRFAFKSREKVTSVGAAGSATPATATPAVGDASTAGPAKPADAPALASTSHAGAEVRGKERERLVLSPPRGSNGDLALSELVDCDIELSDGVAAIWVDRLVRCRVVSLPIAGAVHINSCTDCTFVLACRQLRCHKTAGTDFYLHAGSHPIIEDCNTLRFAPYSKAGEVDEAAFARAGLNKNDNLWEQVDDFNWLRAQQSPNWSVLPDSERVGHDVAWAPLRATNTASPSATPGAQ